MPIARVKTWGIKRLEKDSWSGDAVGGAAPKMRPHRVKVRKVGHTRRRSRREWSDKSCFTKNVHRVLPFGCFAKAFFVYFGTLGRRKWKSYARNDLFLWMLKLDFGKKGDSREKICLILYRENVTLQKRLQILIIWGNLQTGKKLIKQNRFHFWKQKETENSSRERKKVFAAINKVYNKIFISLYYTILNFLNDNGNQ